MDGQERRDKNTKIIALRVLKHGKRSTSNSYPAPGLQCGDQLQPMLSDDMSPDIATRARARNTRFCSCDLSRVLRPRLEPVQFANMYLYILLYLYDFLSKSPWFVVITDDWFRIASLSNTWSHQARWCGIPNILSDARLPSWAGSGLCLQQQLPLSLTSAVVTLETIWDMAPSPSPRRGCGGGIQRIWEGRSFY